MFLPGRRRGSLFAMGPLMQHAPKYVIRLPNHPLCQSWLCFNISSRQEYTKNGSRSPVLYFWFFYLPVPVPAAGSLKQGDASWHKLWLSAIVDSHVKPICTYLERNQCSQSLNLSNMRDHSSLIPNMVLAKPLAGAVVWARCSPPVCQETLCPFLTERALEVWQF